MPLYAPASAAAAASFPPIIPEPQFIELQAGAVQRPNGIDVAQVIGDVEDLVTEFANAMGEGEYALIVEVDPEWTHARIPQKGLPQAYELEIESEGASLVAATKEGIRWGLRTLADVLQAIPATGAIPQAYICDWPDMKTRGVFVEDKWGPDLMELEDWKGIIDYLAARKMNNLGIGLYGCWCVQYDGGVTEWINVPVPGHPELKREWTIRWYSPTTGQIEQISYLPPIFEQDFFGELVAYGQERGVEVIPYVNSLGHNTLIPRLIPEFAAKNEQGEPEQWGYCLSNPDLVEFVKSWYQQIYEKYLKPNGVHTFHIQLDEVGTAFCRCEKCSQQSMEENLKDWVVTLAGHLVSVGVENVAMYNDQFTRHMQVWDEGFAQRLRDEGIHDHLIIDWWAYSNEMPHDKSDPKVGGGVRSWVKPMTCYYNWSRWDPRQKNVAIMCLRGANDWAEGASSYSVFDPGWGLEFDALAEYSWNPRGVGPIHAFEEKWARVRADGDVLEARRCLDRAFDTNLLNLIAYYAYTYERAGKPWPRQYPLEALEELSGKVDALEFIAEAGARARALLEGRVDELSLNMAAEAARVEAHGVAFSVMLEVYEAATGATDNPISAQAALPEVETALEIFEEAMVTVEENKPRYMVPSCLRDMSVLYEFLRQLAGDLKGVIKGKREWSAVRWFVHRNIAQRDWDLWDEVDQQK